MATAAVISLDDTRQAFAKTSARQELHADLDRWLESVEAHRPDDPPSLEALTPEVLARRQELTGKIAAVLVAQRHGPGLHQRLRPCPHCPRLLPARPAPPRTVHTMVGEVARTRPSCDCPDCQQGFAPRDAALQWSARRTPWARPQAAARLAAEGPLETAQELCTQLTGLSWSDQTIPAVAGALSPELGVLEVSPTAAEMAQRVAERAAGKTGRPLMGLAIDGALVPTRPAQAQGEATGRRRTRARRAGGQGEGQEAQGFRFSLVDQERMVPLVSWYRMAGDEAVGTALKRVKDAGVIPEDQGRVCGLGDGAKWIGSRSTPSFPRPCRAWTPTMAVSPYTKWAACRLVITPSRRASGWTP